MWVRLRQASASGSDLNAAAPGVFVSWSRARLLDLDHCDSPNRRAVGASAHFAAHSRYPSRRSRRCMQTEVWLAM
jgi:hypothetical protein